MTDPTMLPEPVDADIELIGRYLTHNMTLDEMVDFDERLEADAPFQAKAQPLIALWTLPVRWGDVFVEGSEHDSPRQFRKRVKRYLRESRTYAARQREWDGVSDAVGMPHMPLHEITGEKRPRSRLGRWVRRAIFGVVGLALGFVTLVLGIVFFVRPQVSTFQAGAAADSAGRSLPPGGTLWKPAVHETQVGEVRSIATQDAVVTLYSDSRLTVGSDPLGIGKPNEISGIDGAAQVVIQKGKVFPLNAADVLFLFFAGRYHVSHPLKGPTQIIIESGHIWLTPLRRRTYPAGSVITIESVDSLTIVRTALREGGVLPTDTLKNLANNRFVHPAKPKQ